MGQRKRNLSENNQLSLWGSTTTESISLTQMIELPQIKQHNDEYQYSIPVSAPQYSAQKITFVKIVLKTEQGIQDAILFITQSQEGLFHLIFFEKMHHDRLNPRRLEIVLNSQGTHYQRVGNQQHWETDLEYDFDAEEWSAILMHAAQEAIEPRERSLLGYLLKLLQRQFSLEAI